MPGSTLFASTHTERKIGRGNALSLFMLVLRALSFRRLIGRPSVDLAETRYLSDHRGSEPRGLARLKEHEQDMLTKYWKPSFQHHPGELIFGSRNSPRCFSEKKNVLRKSELSIQISPPWSSFLDPDPPRPGGNSDTHIFRK